LKICPDVAKNSFHSSFQGMKMNLYNSPHYCIVQEVFIIWSAEF